MLFSSVLFVFRFLPIVLAVYYLTPRKLRNAWLLLASLVFYAWGEPVLWLILVVSILANWGFGLWVERARERGSGKGVVALAVAFNVALLVVFKYADWLWGTAGMLLGALGILHEPLATLGSHFGSSSALHSIFLGPTGSAGSLLADDKIRLPLGVSFFTFQATSYVIDIFRRDVECEKKLVNFAMYKSFFPQLIAGPIVRYRDVHVQIHARRETLELFAEGVRRFVIGLGKKMLVANVCAKACDSVFAIPSAELTPSVAWLGIVGYTLQIYFDFSGYSDMAIGLGKMFGFRFLENFDYPYVSRSITEFWRRWHISLSSWFRDYLYIPLGGNRLGQARTYLNLVVVFFLCGLWHGANVTFVVWGLFHGLFLVIERVGLGAWLERRGAWIRHAYVLLAVMIGWLFFRANDIGQALAYLRTMFGFQDGSQLVAVGDLKIKAALIHHVDLYADRLTWIAIAAGIVGSMPWLPRLQRWHAGLAVSGKTKLSVGLEVAGLALLSLVFVLVAMDLAAGAYNPFIYFRF